MVFQPAPLTAQVKCLFTTNDNEKRVSFSLFSKKASAAWTEVDLAALAASVVAAINADYVPVLSEDHAFLGVEARDLANEFPVIVEDMEAAPVAGTVASPALPSNVAVHVRWLGAAGNAPRQGGINLLSPTESQATNSRLTGAALTAYQAVAAALRASVEDPAGVASASQAIISRYAGTIEVGESQSGKKIKEAVKRVPDAVVNGVSQYRVEDLLRTQRKRLPAA